MTQNSFDDLIPKEQRSAEQVSQPNSGGEDSFADLVPKDQDQSDSPQLAQGHGAFMTAVESFNRSFDRTAEGVLQLASPVLPNRFNQAVDERNRQKEQQLAFDAVNHPVAAAVGEMAGYISQGVVMPTSKASILSRIATNTLAGAGLGAAQYGDATDRSMNALYGAAAGLIGSSAVELGHALKPKSTSGFIKRMWNPEGAAVQDLTAQVAESGGLEGVKTGTAAARALDETISPAEAMGGRILPVSEAGARITSPEQRFAVANMLNPRDERMTARVTKLINDFVPEGEDIAKATQKRLYEEVAPLRVPDVEANKILSNSVVQNELSTLKGAKLISDDLKGMPDNSVLKLDAIKKQIDRQLYKNSPIFTDAARDLLPEERTALQAARNEIVNTIDSIYPQYGQARKVSERLILKKDMLEDLASIRNTPREAGEIPLDKIYNKLWGTPEKQTNFLDAVQRTGGDTETAQNVLTFLNQIRQSPLETLIKKPENTGQVYMGQSAEGMIQQTVQKITSGKYNDAMIKLMTNTDRWQEEVTKALSKQEKSPGMAVMALKNVLDKVKKTRVGTFLRNKFSEAGSEDVVPDNPNSIIDTMKANINKGPSGVDNQRGAVNFSSGLKPRMNPDDYMPTLNKIMAEEEEAASRYSQAPSDFDEGYIKRAQRSALDETPKD